MTTRNKVRSWIELSKNTGLNGSVMDAIRVAYSRGSEKAVLHGKSLSEFDKQLLESWGYEPQSNGNVIEVAV